MKNLIKDNWLSFTIIILATIWAFTQLAGLPNLIPTHFDLNGVADKYSEKHSALYLLPVTNLLLVFFVYGLMKVSPGEYSARQSQSSVAKLILAITLFLMLLYFAMIKEATQPGQWMYRLLPLGFSVLTIMMGNYLGKIERNFVAGVRLPWTLASEQNWKQTHRFAGKAHVTMGVASLVVTLIYPIFWISILFLGIAILATVIFSYNYYRKHEFVDHSF